MDENNEVENNDNVTPINDGQKKDAIAQLADQIKTGDDALKRLNLMLTASRIDYLVDDSKVLAYCKSLPNFK